MKKTLYNKNYEHDACGIGACVSIDGKKSHQIVSDALTIVEKLQHRAGSDIKGEVGDGVGILVQISHNFFKKLDLGFDIGQEREYGIGMFFFPKDSEKAKKAQKTFEDIVKKSNAEFIGWRELPTDNSLLKTLAKDTKPTMMQAFIKKPCDVACGLDFDKILYVIRREFEKLEKDTYVVSCSSRTLVYKGLLMVDQLRNFYLDLLDEDYISAIAMVHSRFSTNTQPSWERAHPNRVILHNGEINTIRGNEDRMFSREETMSSDYVSANKDKIYPIVNVDGSDSARFDNTLEFLLMNDVELPLAMMLTIPEPWKEGNKISKEKKDFYHYYATMMEPWDGPAAILFSDGDVMGATLDRNGLRPSRYYITSDNVLILSSEIGVLDIPAEKVVKKSRLEPGKMLLVDTINQKIISDEEIKNEYATKKPYGQWIEKNLTRLDDIETPKQEILLHSNEIREKLYKNFGYAYEDVKGKILPMAKNGIEPTAAMGVDVPLAPLSKQRLPVFKYFKQLFAQVTNPPIDSLREEIVTDTTVFLGATGNILNHTEENCNVLEITNPILSNKELLKIKNLNKKGFKIANVSILYNKETSLEQALENMFKICEKEQENGANIVILSDRGIDENTVAIPSLLAVSGLDKHFMRLKKRTSLSIVLESAEPRDTHQFATLLGFGALAINPYLAHECIADLINRGILQKDYDTAVHDYNHAVIHGIVKIGAKMGISCVQSYQSSQIFEAIGLNDDVVNKYFTNTVTPVSGVGLDELSDNVLYHHSKAFDALGLDFDESLDSIGFNKMRSGDDKETHLYNPETMIALQQATRNSDYNRFKEYSAMVDNEHRPHTLRALMEFDFENSTAISIDEVEPVSEIVKRFKTGAMSYGSISKEAHECMAIAMNTLGGKSNSGEGGETKDRLGTIKNSAIKQVASGRFGVTSEYLLSANEIQIKLAQGAKPGEGGHLPAGKVYPWIAKTRHSTPGVSLISPPPHHDIYSIEDLAQLIYDLKNANEKSRISVKLVSEAGVGTIAAGVAKAGAAVVLISGFDGGTGAAPQTSISDTGLPWELGLAETHQTLIQNGLRHSVVVETDGKLMTGRDIAIATLLGAEEFGFATAPLVTLGCMMMRVCHLDTCPFGVATQNETLRSRFCGKPEYVINFMNYIAQEMREIMAKLGFKTVDEMVGMSNKLKARDSYSDSRYSLIDLEPIISFAGNEICNYTDVYDFKLSERIDHKVFIPEFENALKTGEKHSIDVSVHSLDRTAGTIFGSKVTENFGTSLADDTFTINCNGGAGQSFGAFLPKGVTMNLCGDSNDYIGKGLSGGKISVFPPIGSPFNPRENVIIGNVALYGATSGEIYINGKAGERFLVRNSGATAVVEGVGDHALEYMTGGRAMILGETGKNVAAGMSGGIAYIFDENNKLSDNLNPEFVTAYEISTDEDKAEIKEMITNHINATNSPFAKELISNIDFAKFRKIIPNDYKKMLESIKSFEDQGMNLDDAKLAAFTASLKR